MSDLVLLSRGHMRRIEPFNTVIEGSSTAEWPVTLTYINVIVEDSGQKSLYQCRNVSWLGQRRRSWVVPF